jgi:hypothetical protein
MKKIYSSITIAIAAILMLAGCKRNSDTMVPAEFPANGNVFLDNFSSGLNYAAFGNSNPSAFDVDRFETYNGTAASMRFEVPDLNDPRGAYAGGCFFTSSGRNLSRFDALTFYIKASKAANIDIIGFGNDLGANKYQVSVAGLPVTTNWTKVVIPIPDAALLTAERGMLFYSEGAENDRGYTFWIDEVKFEKLGTISNIRPSILNGDSVTVNGFAGLTQNISGLSCLVNLPTGIDSRIDLSVGYFNFQTSNSAIATVSAGGTVSIVGGPGNAVITAMLGSKKALGKMKIISSGVFNAAPNPTHNPADVISIFSNAYTNQPVEYYNGYWAPFQTTLSADFEVNGNNILHYYNFNFVGIQFSTPTINVSSMTHFRADIYFPGSFSGVPQFKIQLVDFGVNGVFGGGDDKSHTITYTVPTITSQNWISFDIPLSAFTNLTSRSNMAQIIFEGTNIQSFYADNIYFRR